MGEQQAPFPDSVLAVYLHQYKPRSSQVSETLSTRSLCWQYSRLLLQLVFPGRFKIYILGLNFLQELECENNNLPFFEGLSDGLFLSWEQYSPGGSAGCLASMTNSQSKIEPIAMFVHNNPCIKYLTYHYIFFLHYVISINVWCFHTLPTLRLCVRLET